MKTWEFNYNGSKIEVVNGWRGEKLIVNNVVQDEQIGLAFRSRLYGSVKSESQDHQIKVSVGGWLHIECIVFIDNKEVYRSSKKKVDSLT